MTTYIGLTEAAAEMGISRTLLRVRCQAGVVEGARKIGQRWIFPVSGDDTDASPPEPLVTGMQAAEELGLSRQMVSFLCQDGLIQGAYKAGRSWIIPTPVVRLPGSIRRRNGLPPDGTTGWEGMITLRGAAVQLGMPEKTVRELCKAGLIDGAHKPGRDWRIPTPAVVLGKTGTPIA